MNFYMRLNHEPEKVCHALVAGFVIWISHTHEVKSNRESGDGRYDIMIIPKTLAQIGKVIQFKSVDADSDETMEAAQKAGHCFSGQKSVRKRGWEKIRGFYFTRILVYNQGR